MGILIPLLAALAAGALVYYLGWLIIKEREARVKQRSLAFVTGYASHDPAKALAEAEATPSVSRAIVIGIGRRLTTQKGRRRVEQMAYYAGLNEPLIADDTLIRKVLFLVIGFLIGLMLAMVGGGVWWVLPLLFGIAGFWVPDLLIYNKGLHRDEEMGRALPDALDLLNLCVESGLGFQAALAQVATHQDGPIAEEFTVALQEMQLGRSRGQAMEAMAERTRQQDVRRFISAMLQVDKLGVPVATVLREQAKEMRAKRFTRAREAAQKVPLKILMPLMLCFLPAMFIVILGPAAYSIYVTFTAM